MRATAAGRSRAWIVLVVVAVVVVAIVVLALVAPSRRTDGPPLDTSSSRAQGTKAAVELARRLGADVEVTSDLPDASADVAIVFEDLLGDDDLDAIDTWIAAGHTLVVAAPSSVLTPLGDFEDGDPFADSQPVARGDCDAAEPVGLDDLDELESFGPVVRFEVPPDATSCFRDDAGAVVVVQRIGAGRLVSVGTPWVFTNEALDQADNAGLFAALAVPEEGTRLQVLVAGERDDGLQPVDDGDGLTLPTGVALGLLQLFVAFVVYCLYRSRRLGKPVVEDPPVVIAGSELTRAVGGLLEHAGARDRAATSVRRSARRRLASAFGLPVGADPEQVVAVVAGRTTIDRPRLERALFDAPVADDAALAALGRELDDLVDAALGRPVAPRPAPSAPADPVDPPSATPGDLS